MNQEFAIKVHAFISQNNNHEKVLTVDNSTDMIKIKKQFQDDFFPGKKNFQADWSEIFVVLNNIVLENDFSISKLKRCLGMGEEKLGTELPTLSIYSKATLPEEVKGKILVLWVDPNLQQNRKTYDYIVNKLKVQSKIQMCQFKGNEELQQWLDQNKGYSTFLYEMRKLFFISNMNRPPSFKQEGIETLKLAKKSRENQSFVFYIGDKKKCSDIIQQRLTQQERYNVKIINEPKELALAFVQDFLNPLLKNQSGIFIQNVEFDD